MRQTVKKPALNPNSPKQMEVLYYEDWGLKHNLMRPKIERLGKRSTDALVRESILRNEFTSYSFETAREESNSSQRFTTTSNLWTNNVGHTSRDSY